MDFIGRQAHFYHLFAVWSLSYLILSICTYMIWHEMRLMKDFVNIQCTRLFNVLRSSLVPDVIVDACCYLYLSQNLFLICPSFQPFLHVTESQTLRNVRELEGYLSLPFILSSCLPANAWISLDYLYQIFIQPWPSWHWWNLLSGWSSNSLGFIIIMVVIFAECLVVATCCVLNILHAT